MIVGSTRQPLPDDDKRIISMLITACDPFRELSVTLTYQVMRTFWIIAQEEGLSINEYSTRAGVSKSVMSRHVMDLSYKRRTGEEGFGLLMTRPDPAEMRHHQVFLTPTGKAFAHRMIRAVRSYVSK